MGITIPMADELDTPATDIVLKIDFLEGGSAARPFLIAADLIRALGNIDEALIKSVDSAIETALIVEDLQKSCIKVFLKNVLKHADDDALKILDWKPLVGQYLPKELVRGFDVTEQRLLLEALDSHRAGDVSLEAALAAFKVKVEAHQYAISNAATA